MRDGFQRIDERHVGKNGHVARVFLCEHAGERLAEYEWD
jgi:hypothetical protein